MNIPEFLEVILIPVIVLAAALAMMAVEALQSGRKWPKVPGWWFRALLLNGVQVGAVWIAGVGWNGWMLRHTGRGTPTALALTAERSSDM